MNKNEAVLAILASAGGATLSPVQLQKAAFLISRNAVKHFDENSRFDFQPYDYGPFDKSVYDEASLLSLRNLAKIMNSPNGRWSYYSASEEGVRAGQAIIAQIPDESVRQYIQDVVSWVRGQSFSGLVKSIYEAYPEMKENSIFQDS